MRVLVVCALIVAGILPAQDRTMADRVLEAQQFQARGDFQRAESIFLEVLQEAERRGGDLRAMAAALDNLSGAAADLGRYADAERLSLRALAATQKATGPNSPATAHALWNLAAIYMEAGRRDAADPLLRRFEAIAPRDVQSDPVHASENLENLAISCLGRRAFDQAMELFQQALDLAGQQPGDSPRTAFILIDRAVAYGHLRRYEEAVRDIAGAGEIVSGLPQAPLRLRLALAVASGFVYARAKQEANARRWMEEAVRLAEGNYGPAHPILATVLRNYATALRETGHKKEAVALDRRAALILDSSHRTEPMGISVDANTLAWRPWPQK